MQRKNARDVDDLRAALRLHRLSRTWSYERLAAHMSDVLGAERAPSLRTIHNFLAAETEPLETTTYVIAEYLDKQGVAA
jgi:sugar diacid utilization regulator